MLDDVSYWSERLGSRSPRRSDRRTMAVPRWSALAFALLALALALEQQACFLRHRDADRAAAAAVAGDLRPVEARLEGLRYAAWHPGTDRRDWSPDQRSLFLAVKRESAQGTPSNLAALGFLYLLTGRSAAAIEILGRNLPSTTASGKADPVLQTDLAAAYLDQGSAEQPMWFARAISLLDQALAQRPNLLAAQFDRALALERLTARQAATKAWKAYLFVETDPDWSHEARLRLDRLAETDDDQRCHQTLLSINAQSVSTAAAAMDIRHCRQAGRIYGEAQLGQWAAASIAGKPTVAAEALSVAHAIGEALVSEGGDTMLRDSVERIDRASQAGSGARTDLIVGHAAYAAGLARLDAGDYAGAVAPLRQALKALDRVGSPFSRWATFQLAECAYQQGDPATAQALLAQTESALGGLLYPAVVARARWLRGTIVLFAGHLSDSLQSYRSALALFEKLGEAGNACAVHTLIASNLSFLGDDAGAWPHRYRALVGLRGTHDIKRRRATLGEAVRSLRTAGETSAALYLQDELVASMPTGAPASYRVVALRDRARIEDGLGHGEEALRDLAAAQEATAAIRDPATKDFAIGENLVAEAEIRGRRDPAAGLAAAELALTMAERQHDRQILPELFVEKVAFLKTLGRPILARSAAELGIAECEREGKLVDAASQAAYFSHMRELYVTMVHLQADAGHEMPAFAYAERSRDEAFSGLPESLDGGSGRQAAATVQAVASAIIRNLPPGVAILEYEASDSGLLVWMAGKDALLMRRMPIAASWLQAAASHFRQLASRPPRNEADRLRLLHLGEQLYDSLILPVRADLVSATRIVMIPDPAWRSLPFAALYDKRTGHYLGEAQTVTVAPSAGAYIRCLHRRQHQRSALTNRALVVDASHFNHDLFPTLNILPAAAREARAVADALPGAQLLSGDAATAAAFLAAAGDATMIHFAGHSLANLAESRLSLLLLAPLHGNSGTLAVCDLAGARLDYVELFVAAACNSAADTSMPAGGPAGMAAALLAAGVPAVIGSLWSIDDRTTQVFFERFYLHLRAGEDAAEALRLAAEDLRRSGDATLRAPYAWAAFELYGGTLPDRCHSFRR